jgi:hypothetical protein
VQLPRFDSFRFFALRLPAVRSLIVQAFDQRLTQPIHISEAFECVSR